MTFDPVFARLCAALQVRTQVELAELLDIRQSSISDAKRRDSIPSSWLAALAMQYGLHPRWVMTGSGGKYVIASDDPSKAILKSELDRLYADARQQSKEELVAEFGVAELLSLLREALPEGVTISLQAAGVGSSAIPAPAMPLEPVSVREQ